MSTRRGVDQQRERAEKAEAELARQRVYPEDYEALERVARGIESSQLARQKIETRIAEAEEARLRALVEAWEREVGAEIPADCKDWHDNDADEHPVVARAILELRRDDCNLAWLEVDRLRAERDRLAGIIEQVRELAHGNNESAQNLRMDLRAALGERMP
jgi:hypothetical protein